METTAIDYHAAALEREDLKRLKLHRQLLSDRKEDGAPFGLAAGQAYPGLYILHVTKGGSADLYKVQPDGISDRLAHVPAMMWPEVSAAVEFDFNVRMANANKPAGSWPEATGTVRLHPCFGRELEVAMHVGSESLQDGPANLKLWLSAAPDLRFSMWKKWQAVCNADASQTIADLLYVVRADAMKARRIAGEAQRVIKPLCRYVLEGDQSALDDVFNINVLNTFEQRQVRTLSAFNMRLMVRLPTDPAAPKGTKPRYDALMLDPQCRLDRSKMVQEARDFRAQRDAELEARAANATDEVVELASLPALECRANRFGRVWDRSIDGTHWPKRQYGASA